MKVCGIDKPKSGYRSLNILIKLEALKEVQAFYALFNIPLVTDALKGYSIDHNAIREFIEGLEPKCGESSAWNKINDRLRGEEK